jgi:hypothetical protein|tara:strand:- start:22366 stop:22548 length:183 start_codon:yes stop_codon:yes gene_type:complete
MSSLPKKEDSGGSRRRSALTSAFEELALEADKKTDEVRAGAPETNRTHEDHAIERPPPSN